MIELLHVALNFGSAANDIKVGRLLTRQKRIYFEFDPAFIRTNLSISPLRLLPKTGTQTFDQYLFEGLPGVFNDSLPDGWGRLLFDRAMRAHGFNPADLTPLDRLAHVGRHGMGALVYEPDLSEQHATRLIVDLDKIASMSLEVLQGNSVAVLDEMVALNGSSAGARPKALIGVNQNKTKIIHGVSDLPKNYEHWIVKFANSLEEADAGAIEFAYAQMAKLAGIDIPPVYLFPAAKCAGYFAIKRFDRYDNKHLHVHTACGLLHSDFRTPSLDYEDLLRLTLALSKDMREVQSMFNLAVFNVLAHNRDDHAKNFSFLMDANGKWNLSPAYDLTFSAGPNGEQSTSVMGEGRKIGVERLQRLAKAASIDNAQTKRIIDQCKYALSQWRAIASTAGVTKSRIKEIQTSFGCR